MLAALRLALAWVTLFVIGTDLFVVSPIIPLIADDLHVGASGRRPGGDDFRVWLCRRGADLRPYGGPARPPTGADAAAWWCSSAANLLTADGAPCLPAMMAARLLCGIAAAGVTPSIYVLAGISAPAGRRGTWIAIVLTGLLSSLPLGAPIGAMVSLAFGWPAVFVCLAACSLLLAPVHRAIWPDAPPGSTAPRRAAADGFSAVALALTPRADGGLEHRAVRHVHLSRRRARPPGFRARARSPKSLSSMAPPRSPEHCSAAASRIGWVRRSRSASA